MKDWLIVHDTVKPPPLANFRHLGRTLSVTSPRAIRDAL